MPVMQAVCILNICPWAHTSMNVSTTLAAGSVHMDAKGLDIQEMFTVGAHSHYLH